MAKQSNTLTEIREAIIENLIKDLEIPRKDANSIASSAVDTIREKWGGTENLYIPRSDNLEDRDWKMWELFNGTNYDEVGKAFDLTGRQARNRIRIIRPIAEKRDQAGLFDKLLAEAV